MLEYACWFPGHATHVIAVNSPPEWTSDFVRRVGKFWEKEASAGRKAQHEKNLVALTPDYLKGLTPDSGRSRKFSGECRAVLGRLDL